MCALMSCSSVYIRRRFSLSQGVMCNCSVNKISILPEISTKVSSASASSYSSLSLLLFITEIVVIISGYMSIGTFDTHNQPFPVDPLADVEVNPTASDNYSGWLSEQQSTFEEASKDLFNRRPLIPHSELSCVRSVRPKPTKEKKDVGSAHGREVAMNRHKLALLPPKSDPYELVKLVRKGWTLSKVGNATKPTKAKRDPQAVEKDIEKFSTRLRQRSQKSSGFSVGDRYSPTNWPHDDTVSLASGVNDIKRYRAFEVPGPRYSKEIVGNGRAYSFAKSDRLPEPRMDVPDTMCDLNKASRSVQRSSGSPRLDTSGRDLYGSIYWEQFSLKSAGNYYNGHEAYLQHTTAPAAIPSLSVTLPPREESPQFQSKRSFIAKNRDPLAKVIKWREKNEAKKKNQRKRNDVK